MVEAVCLGSGPSLTPADIETVREWRAAAAGRIVIVTNTTFRDAPWADALYGMDSKWWRAKPQSQWPTYADEAKATFAGMLCTCSIAYRQFDLVNARARWPGWTQFGNSGAGAVNLARCMGANRIFLLGYDCQRTKGKAHHHGDHPKGLGNAGSIGSWPAHFEKLAKFMKRYPITIINCSRETALKCFERMPLERALQPVALAA